jgi:hypothetical protein
MIRRCYRCNKIFGEKPPFENKDETSGVCDDCWPLEKVEIQTALKKLREAGWKPGDVLKIE